MYTSQGLAIPRHAGGATQIFPECTEWRSIMILEDKQRQLVLDRVAQAQLSSPRRAWIMFGQFVKGKYKGH